MKHHHLVATLTAAALITSCGGTNSPAPGSSTTGNPTSEGGGAASFNQQQTERLYGSWNFTFTIISTFTETYKLKSLKASTAVPGDYYLAGTDQYNNLVIAGYDSKYKSFSLYDPSITIDMFYTFNFASDNNIKGCYYQINLSTNEMSDCYPLVGNRYSMSTNSLGQSTTQLTLREQGLQRQASGHTPQDSAAYRQYMEVKALAQRQ